MRAAQNGLRRETRRETYLSTKPFGPQTPPRLSQAHADKRWRSRSCTPPGERPQASVRLNRNCPAAKFTTTFVVWLADTGISRASVKLLTLKKRAQFLRVRGGVRKATRGFVMEAKLRPQPKAKPVNSEPTSEKSTRGAQNQSPPLFGFTITKKIGNAVARNRIRRRLKSAISEVAPENAHPDCDYVIVARRAALAMPFGELQKDLTDAFTSINRRLARLK